MRRHLTQHGITELRTASDVDEVLSKKGTVAIAVNSACGCSATRMRPAFIKALQQGKKPDVAATVFAGQDLEATARVRAHITDYPPSSPSVALFRDGQLVYMLQRKDIERRTPDDIAEDIVRAFEQHC